MEKAEIVRQMKIEIKVIVQQYHNRMIDNKLLAR